MRIFQLLLLVAAMSVSDDDTPNLFQNIIDKYKNITDEDGRIFDLDDIEFERKYSRMICREQMTKNDLLDKLTKILRKCDSFWGYKSGNLVLIVDDWGFGEKDIRIFRNNLAQAYPDDVSSARVRAYGKKSKYRLILGSRIYRKLDIIVPSMEVIRYAFKNKEWVDDCALAWKNIRKDENDTVPPNRST